MDHAQAFYFSVFLLSIPSSNIFYFCDSSSSVVFGAFADGSFRYIRSALLMVGVGVLMYCFWV